MKKVKLFSILLIVLLVVGCGCSKNNKKEKKIESNPNQPKINYEKIGDLKIGASSFYISGNYTFISVSIINESNKDITPNSVSAILKDEAGNIIKTELITVGTIKANNTLEIKDHYIYGRYINASTISFEIK